MTKEEDIALACELFEERGRMVHFLMEEKGMGKEEAQKYVMDNAPIDPDTLDFMCKYKEEVEKTIAIEEAKNETKH